MDEDAAKLLEGLEPGSPHDAWMDLWSELCHQGTVYPASFEALPILADLAERWPPEARLDPLSLAGSILASRDFHDSDFHGPHGSARERTRDELFAPVADSVPGLRRSAREALDHGGWSRNDFVLLTFRISAGCEDLGDSTRRRRPLSAGRRGGGGRGTRPVRGRICLLREEETARARSSQFGCGRDRAVYLLEASLALDDIRPWGTVLDDMVGGEFPFECPSCGELLVLRFGSGSAHVTPCESRERTSPPRSPASPARKELPDVGRRMVDEAVAGGHDDVAAAVRHVIGTTACPLCGEPISVADAIAPWAG